MHYSDEDKQNFYKVIEEWHSKKKARYDNIADDLKVDQIHYLERMHLIALLEQEVIKYFKIRFFIVFGIVSAILILGTPILIDNLIDFAALKVEMELRQTAIDLKSDVLSSNEDDLIEFKQSIDNDLSKFRKNVLGYIADVQRLYEKDAEAVGIDVRDEKSSPPGE